MRGQGANPMGRVRAPPCHHLRQNPGPARLPNGIGERHILHASEGVRRHPLGFPRSSPMLRTSENAQNANFAKTAFSEVRHSPGPTPRSVPDSELSRDRRPPRKAAVPVARAPSSCSRGQAFPCGSKHPPARCSSLCRSLRYRCGGMRKPCGKVALDIHNAAIYSVAMYTRIRVR